MCLKRLLSMKNGSCPSKAENNRTHIHATPTTDTNEF